MSAPWQSFLVRQFGGRRTGSSHSPQGKGSLFITYFAMVRAFSTGVYAYGDSVSLSGLLGSLSGERTCYPILMAIALRRVLVCFVELFPQRLQKLILPVQKHLSAGAYLQGTGVWICLTSCSVEMFLRLKYPIVV